MEQVVERELTVPDAPEEVWRSLAAEPRWLGEDASIALRPDGEVRAGERRGWVETVEPPRRLAFWWGAEGEDATRVELELEPTDEGTRVVVVESRPLAVLDAVGDSLPRDLGLGRPPRGAPELSATRVGAPGSLGAAGAAGSGAPGAVALAGR